MRLTQIFEDVKKQWPRDILIGDCILWDDQEGLSCEWLDGLFWDIDTKSVHGEWGNLMCWGIFCGLKKHIKTLQPPYPNKIPIDCLDLKYAVEKINESINIPESVYYPERHKYENDLDGLLKDQVGELDS
ncbi:MULTISPECIES: hypothetical protein [unclassified Pseudodesulfovibrio]|uniref:hypothetical protein n=1 Tax=unclassified Pseudodesulfovibrio TaxID=2661612 RepID=UPI000FEBAC61|nr:MULTISPECIES: hypothetical protein [unclassified Pseudodesulfovibrio]MCJ2163634.1 hypothetical protein [Pseudodesulfovibrio sp. S3-i]RWU06862.1 hypothetical protein DWB63_03650 [Pseudodesulfovibrio sp. S3]